MSAAGQADHRGITTTFRTAVVGVDASTVENPLLGCVPDLSTWGVERVALIHVIHVDYGRFGGMGHEDRYRTWLEELAEPLRAKGLEIETMVTASGRPGMELLARAHDHDADLVVVGSRSRQLTQRLFLGSVAREVIHDSDLPVLVERMDASEGGERCVAACEHTLERVVLATDLSDESAGAEASAVQLAPGAGSIDCLVVLDDDGAGLGGLSIEHVEQAAAAIVGRIEAAGGRGTVRIERGDPAQRIPSVAAEGYSMVVVGKHGRGRVADTVIGSTALRVAEAAGVAVLLVPR